ncbi:DELTA-stichotoxin-Hcr4a [Exaiptasia diaphana]|uniref:Actinoporin n=1 Tax=Exaiptasia diaphana TaxID=2652724 RepID=A0A913X9E1_EXADI|nr:DELTA-stichotoxin-Hcr4a [Exaiptasia diaphana]
MKHFIALFLVLAVIPLASPQEPLQKATIDDDDMQVKFTLFNRKSLTMKHFIALFLVLAVIPLASPQEPLQKATIDDDDMQVHKDKRVISAGTAIAVGQFSINVLNNVLAAIGKVSRKIAIGVENESGLKWEALNVFFRYGASDITLPMKVENAKALLYTARKSHSIFMTGTSAVFTYSMSDGNTLAVLFVVPYNKLSFSNWWNVKVYNGRKMADWRMWKELYNKNPFPANAWHQRNLGYGVKVKGYMTNAGEATLQIRISKA